MLCLNVMDQRHRGFNDGVELSGALEELAEKLGLDDQHAELHPPLPVPAVGPMP